MLKLSKRIEYALMAVKYIAKKDDTSCITAKEIAEGYNIPYDLLSKILQQLTKGNIIESYQGNKGGYSLCRKPSELTLIDIIQTIEPDYYLTDCMGPESTEENCARVNCCMIRNPLAKVQMEIERVFKSTTIQMIL